MGVFQLVAIALTVQALPEGETLADACNVQKINVLYDKLLTRNAFAMAQDSGLFLAGNAEGTKEHVAERRQARVDLITQMMERCMGSRWTSNSDCTYLNSVVTDDNIKQIIEILRFRTLKSVASARAH